MWNRRARQDDAEPSKPKLPGVIDTIGLGFERLVARPYVIVVPVLVDLFLWLGLKVTAGPLTARLARWLGDAGGSEDVIADQRSYNVLEFISLQLPTVRLPTLMPLLADPASFDLDGIGSDLVLSWWQVAAVALAALLISYLIGAMYLRWLAEATSGRNFVVNLSLDLRAALRLLGWALQCALIFALVAFPLIATSVALAAVGAGISGLIFALAMLPIAWGFIFFFFAALAIVVDGVSAIDSFRRSYRVVRGYFWQSLGFIVAFMLVTGGFPFFWRLLLNAPAGVAIAIMGNAFVASGMLAAAMLFYRDRATELQLADSSQGRS